MSFFKSIRGDYGNCIIRDCTEGMKFIGDNQFDLCFTDPPWGYDFDGQNPVGANKKVYHKPDKVNYEDEFNEQFQLEYFKEIRRISKGTVIVMGRKHLFWWIRNTDPIDLFVLTFKNGTTPSLVSKHNGVSYWICYGREFFKEHKFHRNFVQTYIENGFLSKNKHLKHPSPKDFKTWVQAIKDLNPSSVIDPFMGSGTIGEVCEFLGVSWKGFEIEEKYIADIKWRVEKGKERRRKMPKKPKSLMEM